MKMLKKVLQIKTCHPDRKYLFRDFLGYEQAICLPIIIFLTEVERYLNLARLQVTIIKHKLATILQMTSYLLTSGECHIFH